MDEMNQRTSIILGEEGVERMRETSVILAGCGAVGGYALEGLVRAGVGRIRVVDGDVFSESNLNRQVLCTTETVGMPKVEAACRRARSINPDIEIEAMELRVDDSTIPRILGGGFDYLVDAIDTVSNKSQLLSAAAGTDLRVCSSMGAALRTDPSMVKVAPLNKTKVCPLAANVRKRLRANDTSNIICVYSEEPQFKVPDARDDSGKSILGSLPTIPAIFGMTLANLVIMDASGLRRLFRFKWILIVRRVFKLWQLDGYTVITYILMKNIDIPIFLSIYPMPNPDDIYWNSFLPAFFDRMSVLMRKNMTTMVTDYGLTSAHAIYLIALKLQDGQTLVSLSRFLDLDTANTNRVIKVLRDKGFVYDDRKTESSKKYSIYLTESGQELATKLMDGITALNNSYFEDIPREDILHMRNTLIHILNNMNVGIDSYMGSKYEDPFYTHLHIRPLDDDYYTEPRLLEDNDDKIAEESEGGC